MIDNKSIAEHNHEFENIIYDMKFKENVLHEIMIVTFMISKLSKICGVKLYTLLIMFLVKFLIKIVIKLVVSYAKEKNYI